MNTGFSCNTRHIYVVTIVKSPQYYLQLILYNIAYETIPLLLFDRP